MTQTRATIAAEARRLIDDEGWSAQQVAEWIMSRMPEFGPAAIKEVFELMALERHEYAEQERAEIEQLERLKGLFAGLPPGTKLGEAAKIKAAAGDPFAKQMHAQFSSSYYRVFHALLDAAVDRHPDYKHTEQGFCHVSGQPMPDNIEQTLVEWFQMNYPREARAIEERDP